MSYVTILWSVAAASALLLGIVHGSLWIMASRLARELDESERRLDLAAASAGLGLWAWSGKDRLWMTDRARAILGFSNDDTIDLDQLVSRVHGDDMPVIRAAVQRAVARGGEHVLQFRTCPPNGPVRWIAARGSCEPGSRGRPASMRGVLRDVTDQKEAAAEADELRRELAHAGRVTMLGQLASALAHELSQPLGAILRNAEAAEIMLQRPSPDIGELRAIMADIHKDDRRAGELIERLRELLKRRQMNFQPLAVEALVDDVIALVRPDAAARHVTLQCATCPGLPQVPGDRVHMSQVLINLIINAVDATVEAGADRRYVVIEAQPGTNRSVEVAVTDSGPGILPERMDRIFDPFFTTKPDGMGMGLSVSRTIVEAHGGRLWAENGAAGGATFRFTLPVAEGLGA